MADSGDRVFCHACGGVWPRNQHGLVCPQCESDFTEIVEIPPEEPEDPPEVFPGEHHSPPRDRAHSPINPWANHNPWAHEEDDYNLDDPHGFGTGLGNGYSHRTYRSPDGRFTFTSTTLGGSGFPPRRPAGTERDMPGDPLMPMMRSLDTIFQGFAEVYRNQDQRETSRETPTNDDSEPNEHARERSPPLFTPPLQPRDAGNAQPMTPPLQTLGDILDLFRPEAGTGTNAGPRGNGFRVVAGGPAMGTPMGLFSALMNLTRHGDAVYSQEELDRVISQLVDQNSNGTAPPPASQDAIRSLTKRKIDHTMLGSEGKAECSICMDPVDLGTEVTELPCKHWFHYGCIEMWLNQHNTCPQCRRGIDTPGQPEGSSENPVVISDSPEPPSPNRRSSNTTPEHSGRSTWFGQRQNSNEQPSTESDRRRSRGESTSGGLTGWIRNRLGGGT